MSIPRKGRHAHANSQGWPFPVPAEHRASCSRVRFGLRPPGIGLAIRSYSCLTIEMEGQCTVL